MSTEFFNDQWRIPSNENQNKVSNYSMDFNGSSDKIEVQDASNEFGFSNNRFSLSAWVFIDSNTTQNGLIAKRNIGTAAANKMWYFEINTSSQLRFLWYNTVGGSSNASSTDTIPLNTWTHVVVTSDGTGANGLNFYINESVDSGGSKTGPSSASSIQQTGTPLWVGARGGNSSAQYTSGKIDQVSIFDYELSASQVSTLYGGGTAVTNPMSLSPKPIAYYQLGEQSVDNGANYLVPNNRLSDYVFNFSSDLINVANDTTIARQQNISYSLWVNTTSLTAQQYIIGNTTSSNKGTGIFIINNALHFQIGNNTNDSYFDSKISNLSTYVSANSWFHVAASWDGTDSKIYINSIERNSWTPTQPYTIAGWSAFMIGDNATISSSSYFSGKLSNVAFWNSGLTLTQVTTLYNNGAPNDISSLSPVGWWKLNDADTFDGSNWTINDYGSGGNDGTSSGMDSSNLVVSDLQQTSGYSPYALDFDGADDYLDTPQINLGSTNTISFWINNSATNIGTIFGDPNAFGNPSYALVQNTSTGDLTFRLGNNDAGYWRLAVSSGLLSDGNWHHHCLSRNGVTINYYIDGILQTNVTNNTLNASAGTNTTIEHIMANTTLASFASGKLSNVALWNTALTSTEVTEIYNQGVPSNLNNFSGTAPVSWWQLGSNSSFNTNWTCLDEIGTNNASSVNMANNDIVDGVGYSASGLGTSSIDIKGDAPYSTANGLSENMDVLDRTTDVPS